MTLKTPYGISNFRDVVMQDYDYVDKTAYVEQLENVGKYNILLRPRRFGKSLLLSTLWHYYDVLYQAEFAILFGRFYIGKHPTPLKNSYQVLFMEFSGIETEGDYASVLQDFDREVANALKRFLQRYGYPVETQATIEAEPNPHSKMKAFWRLMDGQ